MSGPAYAAISAVVAALLLAGASRLIRAVAVFGIAGAVSAQVPVVAAMLALAGPHHQLRALIAAGLVSTATVDRVLAIRAAGLPRVTARTFAGAGWLVGTGLALASASARDEAGRHTAMVVLAIAAVSALPPLTRDVPPTSELRDRKRHCGRVLDARFIADFAGGRVGLCALGLVGGALIATSSKLRSLERWFLSSGVAVAVVSGAPLVGTHPRSLAWIVIAGGGAGALCHGILAGFMTGGFPYRSGRRRLSSRSHQRWPRGRSRPLTLRSSLSSAAAWCWASLRFGAMRRNRPRYSSSRLWRRPAASLVSRGSTATTYSAPALVLTGVAWLLFAALPEH